MPSESGPDGDPVPWRGRSGVCAKSVDGTLPSLSSQRCAIQAAGIGAGGSATTRAGGPGPGAVWLDRWYISTLSLSLPYVP